MAARSSAFPERIAGALLVALLVALAVGCQTERQSVPQGATTEAGWIDLAGLEGRLREDQGRVVVVNFWATWCEPCREEFPDLIRLHQRHADRGLTLLAISLDSPKLRDTKVREFLIEQRPSFPVYVKTAGDDDAFINAVDPEWSGALPATFIYDRSGQRRHTLIGQQTLRSLEAYVELLLAD
ncbi:MAG: TlpA family protein disulfide reductase [Acidobacteria bacterium]|nr:TlpA family protein disulfide reductase [Acidobacteriota bacterium]